MPILSVSFYRSYPEVECASDDDIQDEEYMTELRETSMVGIAGCKGSGKDTLADALLAKLMVNRHDKPLNIKRVAWAAEVKAIIMNYFGVSETFINYWKRRNETPPGFLKPMRELLQHVGDLRTFQSDVWVNATLSSLSSDTAATAVTETTEPNVHPLLAVADTHDLVIITDLRYENECKAVRARGGIVILVGRHPQKQSHDKHSSEQFFAELTTWLLRNTTAAIVVVDSLDLSSAPPSAAYVDYFVRNDEGLDVLSDSAYRIAQQLAFAKTN